MNVPDLVPLEIAAAKRRAELSRNWPNAAEVARAMGSPAASGGQLATQLRRDGQILGVYILEPVHHYRFPSWQFQPDGRPVAHFADILAILREYGGYLDEKGRTTGWDETAWFLSHHALLDGRQPCEVLSQNPESVLEAARVEYINQNDTGGF